MIEMGTKMNNTVLRITVTTRWLGLFYPKSTTYEYRGCFWYDVATGERSTVAMEIKLDRVAGIVRD